MEKSSDGLDFFRTVLLTVLLLLFAGYFAPGGSNRTSEEKHPEAVAVTHADASALAGQNCESTPESLLSQAVTHPSDTVSKKWCRRNEERLLALKVSVLRQSVNLALPVTNQFLGRQYLHLYPDPDALPHLG